MTTGTHDAAVPFEVRLDPQLDRVVVVPSGELDIANADRMEHALLQPIDAGSPHVVADLRELSFIDSSGIRALWRAHVHAQDAGVPFSVVPGAGDVRRALRMTGLLDRLHLLER